jgi:hypothetical protein
MQTGVTAFNGAIDRSVVVMSGTGTLTTGNLFLGDQASKQATVDQTGGSVTVATQFRVGHWPTETSTYNLSAGTLDITAPAGTTFPYASTVLEQNGGVYLGIDGTGILNQTGGTLTTNWIVLDNRGNTVAGVNMATGVDTYSLSAGTLNLTSSFGIISRNPTTAVNLSGGIIQASTSTNLDSDKITVTNQVGINTPGNLSRCSGRSPATACFRSPATAACSKRMTARRSAAGRSARWV